MSRLAIRSLTPGVVDPTITATDVARPGFATSRRPTIWQALKLKGEAMKAYGIPRTPIGWHRHTLDHLIPVELGGAPLDVRNVWPQTKASATAKDRDENAQRRAVVAGSISLADAQAFFVTHWSK